MLTKGAFLFDQNNSKSKKKNSNIVNIAQETFQFSLMNRMFICNKNLLKKIIKCIYFLLLLIN